MATPISAVQQRYLAALVETVGRRRYEQLKRELKIPKAVPMSDLTKDEAYHLISKIMAESTAETIRAALSSALEQEKV